MTNPAIEIATSHRYRKLLQNRNFVLLWSGQSISLVGDIIFLFSINWLILEKTGSALQVGGNIVISVLGTVIFNSVAGTLADRWDRRQLMLISDTLRGGVVLALALALWFTPFNIWYVYATTFLLTCISSFFSPAYQSTIPNILEKESLILGRSFTISTSRLLQAMGSAASGLLIAAFSVEWGIVINALSFFVSALTIFFTHIPQFHSTIQKSLTLSTLFDNTVEGWRFVRSQTVLVSIFLLFTLGDFGAAFTWPVHVIFAEKVLKGGSEIYGLLSTVALLGGFAGAFFVGRYSNWFNQHIGLSYFLAASAWGLFSIFFGLTSSIPFALVYRFIIGWVLSMIHVPITSLLDVSAPDAYRGRVWATIGIGSSVISTLSVGLSGLASDYWSPRASYVIAGSILILAAIISFQLPGIRTAKIEKS
jgi:MFS family permease